MTLSFTIHGAPVPLARPRIANGHACMPERSRLYEKLVSEVARAAVIAAGWHHWDKYTLTLRVYRQAFRGDLDNFVKAVMDGLTKAGVWQDDRFVTSLHATMDVDRENPRVEIEVEAE